MPCDRKRNGGVQENAKVISVIRELPEVVSVQQQVAAERLLEAHVVLIPAAGGNRHGRRSSKDFRGQTADSRGARKKQIFVERGLEGSCVGSSKHRSGLLAVVGHAGARLRGAVRNDTVIDVPPQPQAE